MFTLTISYLTTSSLPWFMHLTFLKINDTTLTYFQMLTCSKKLELFFFFLHRFISMQENFLMQKIFSTFINLMFLCSFPHFIPPLPRMGCFPSSFFFRHLIDSCDTSIEMWVGAYNVERFIADEWFEVVWMKIFSSLPKFSLSFDNFYHRFELRHKKHNIPHFQMTWLWVWES